MTPAAFVSFPGASPLGSMESPRARFAGDEENYHERESASDEGSFHERGFQRAAVDALPSSYLVTHSTLLSMEKREICAFL